MSWSLRTQGLIQRTVVAAVVVAVLALAGCAPQETIIGQDEDGETISVEVGETLLVELVGNPTTGFEWSESGSVPPILERRSSEYIPDEAPGDMVGVGGTYVFRYEAVVEGEGVLSFMYARSGEPPEVDDTLSVTIHVDPDE